MFMLIITLTVAYGSLRKWVNRGYTINNGWFEGSIPDGGSKLFSPSQRPDRLWGTPSLLSNGYRGLFPRGVKQPGREANHSPPSTAEAKNGYGLEDQGLGIRFPAEAGNSFTTASRPALGPTHPPIQWVPGALSPGIKRPGSEAEHSPFSSAEANTPSWHGA
jgi:hypothetical protein